MADSVREMTFDEEYEILQKEKEELFATEKEDCEPPFANRVFRRALRCIRKLLEEIQQYRAIGTVEEIQQKAKEDAIREFAERIKSSQDAYSWCCADGSMEYCNGDHCESCMDDFKEKIDKIAEQALADMKKGRGYERDFI